jgi:hypothetical protein
LHAKCRLIFIELHGVVAQTIQDFTDIAVRISNAEPSLFFYNLGKIREYLLL